MFQKCLQDRFLGVRLDPVSQALETLSKRAQFNKLKKYTENWHANWGRAHRRPYNIASGISLGLEKSDSKTREPLGLIQ